MNKPENSAGIESMLLYPSRLEATLFTLKDGRVALFYVGSDSMLMWKCSDDVGRTWSEGQKCLDVSLWGMVGSRPSPVWLKSGKVGMLHTYVPQRMGRDGSLYFRVSDDGLSPWSIGSWVDPFFAVSRMNTARVLSSGRIVIPVMKWLSPYTGWESEMSSNSLCFTWVKYSDDEGETWKTSASELLVSLDEGRMGVYSFEEAAIEELNNGDVLMLGRTELGCQFRSVSQDGGVTWSVPKPTEIASSYAPLHLVRIPKTGDLMIVWNQASPDEIGQDMSRSRLSVAISKDEGKTWVHHHNLESPDDTTYVPAPPIKVYRKGGYGSDLDSETGRYLGDRVARRICYPSVAFLGDEVLICYDFDTPNGHATKLKVLPLEWFYE